jgi:hypothetical protein
VCLGAHLGLVAANTGDPGFQPRQGLLHGLDLVDVAAQVGIHCRQLTSKPPPEDIPALIAIQVDHVHVHLPRQLLAEDQRVPKVVAGVEEENADIGHGLHGHVQQRQTLRLERGA